MCFKTEQLEGNFLKWEEVVGACAVLCSRGGDCCGWSEWIVAHKRFYQSDWSGDHVNVTEMMSMFNIKIKFNINIKIAGWLNVLQR